MKILITGVCGFVGSTLARHWRETQPSWTLYGLDSLIRAGSESNRAALTRLGVKVFHADLRCASDFETLPEVDFVIDAAANASVLAGVDGRTSSRQILEHNLAGTINILEYCKRVRSGFVLLSTSRVYSIPALAAMRVKVSRDAFVPDTVAPLPAGVTVDGISESYSTAAPISLYGATKLASEALALEYGECFGFPVWINRCGVLAGAGQFGRPDQGIVAFWLHSWHAGRPLKYIGFDGMGHQARDVLHPRDVALLVSQQMAYSGKDHPRIVNVAGGAGQTLSLRQMSLWCTERWGTRNVVVDAAPRQFDLPWVVLDSRRAGAAWGWQPKVTADEILLQIAEQAEKHPDWLELSAV